MCQGGGALTGGHKGILSQLHKESYPQNLQNPFLNLLGSGLLLCKQAQCHLTDGFLEECFHQLQEYNSLFIPGVLGGS